MDDDGLSDPYCIVSFQNQTQKTYTVCKTLCPEWDQTLLFENINMYGSPNAMAENPPHVCINLFDKDFIVSIFFYLENWNKSRSYLKESLALQHLFFIFTSQSCTKVGNIPKVATFLYCNISSYRKDQAKITVQGSKRYCAPLIPAMKTYSISTI